MLELYLALFSLDYFLFVIKIAFSTIKIAAATARMINSGFNLFVKRVIKTTKIIPTAIKIMICFIVNSILSIPF